MKLLTETPVDIELSQIKFEPCFQDMFPLEGAIYQQIDENIKAHGFNQSKAVDIWQKVDGKKKVNILIDGHRRVSLSKKHKLKTVKAYIWEFADAAEAEAYAEQQQGLRRNLNDWDIFYFVRNKSSRNKQGDTRGKNGKERDRLARLLHCSHRKIQECFSLLDRGNAEEIELIRKKSIRFAYKQQKTRMEAEECTRVHSTGNPENKKKKQAPKIKHETESNQKPVTNTIKLLIIQSETEVEEHTWEILAEQLPFLKKNLFQYLSAVCK